MPWEILQQLFLVFRMVNGVKNENNGLAMKTEYNLNDPIEILLKQTKMCIFFCLSQFAVHSTAINEPRQGP